jgi:flagella basal body P-ring formation protein FlgA
MSLLASTALAAAVQASPDRLCEAALADVQRFARSQGWAVAARCRGFTNRALPADARLQPQPWPSAATLASGPLTWPVRVLGDGVPSYVQRVPLNAAWVAPAWVATRSLEAGAVLQPGDVELQALRWPDGIRLRRIEPGELPAGRLRQPLRQGEMLTDAVLLPAQDLVRGDRVTALLSDGGVEVRLAAQLLAPARVGGHARVQVVGRSSSLQGRLVDTKTLQVDSP